MRLSQIAISIVFLLSACAPRSPAGRGNLSPTPVSISSQTPQVLSSATAQPIIEVGTATPLPAVTRTAVPTFTPATPANADYKLRPWTPDQADLLIAQISSQLKAVEDDPMSSTVYGYASYIEQYEYLAFAEMEALLRFPGAPQAEVWRWDLCYNLALSYPYPESSDAPELFCYAKLIENGLNSKQTDIPSLSSWFAAHESRFPFELTSFTPPAGYTSSHIISLEGSANLWLLEKEGEFQVFGLRSSMFFFRGSSSNVELLDLTGDNYPELVLYFERLFCCGMLSEQFVYDLSSGRPEELSFTNLYGEYSSTGSIDQSSLTRIDIDKNTSGLLFEGYYGDPALTKCPLKEYDKYYWSGKHFEWIETWYGIEVPSREEDVEFCQFARDIASSRDELNIVAKAIEPIDDNPPEELRDKILYRLGEYHARLGDVDKAKEFFIQTITSQTTSSKSDPRWTKAAQIFLDKYHEESDYYEVCSKVIQCDMRSALEQLIAEIEPDSFLHALDLLKSSGISIKSNGVVNFDGDNHIEQWLVVQHPNRTKREFWLLVKGPEKIYGVFIAKISTNKPEIKEFADSGTYELMTSDGENLFSLEKIASSGQPYVLAHDLIQSYDPILEDDYLKGYLVEQPLDDLIDQLMNGSDPAQIRSQLVQLSQSTSFDCKSAYSCDQVQYLLGMVSELLGDEQAALDAYLQLWKEYPDSFYTVMVRSKLVSVSP